MTERKRVVVQLDAAAHVLPDEVGALLASYGEVDARAPHPDVLPGLFVATVPGDVDAADLVERLKALPAVRDAELEQLREAF